MSFFAFFWICDVGFQKSINTTVDAASQANLETVKRLLTNTAPKGREAVVAQLRDLDKLWDNGAVFEVADANGEWIFRSAGFLHPRTTVPNASESRISFVTTNLDFNQYRIAMAALPLNGEIFKIHAAVPTEPFDQALDRFRLIEQEWLPALVLIASLLGYWLSGKSLAPVGKIIRTAEMIGVESLSQRLDVPRARDELHRLTQAINAMLDRIERSFQRTTQFTADASHDLRTPLSVIRASAEISLRRPRDAENYQETLRNILQTSIETSALLENLLTLARADAGAAGLEMHPLELGAHVRKAKERAEVLSSEKELELVLNVPAAPVWVRADPLAIDRLLLILVDNAVKYTPAGGRCEIELAHADQHAAITVRDTGNGIAESDLGSIFDRFTRADRARSRHIPGAGLGLAIARWITDMHGGTIAAQSKVGVGSAFQVRIPVMASA